MITTAAASRHAKAACLQQNLKPVLEKLYEKYNRRGLIKPDPLQFVYEYSNPVDMELAGFLAASLAYGRVEQIEKSLSNLLGRMGKSPYQFVLNFNQRDRTNLRDFKHRFTAGDDISDLLMLFKRVLAEYAGLEKFFLKFYSPADENIIPALSRFCGTLLNMHKSASVSRGKSGIAYLLAGPSLGGAAKRLNLFLRWMVRKDDVDTGLWSSIDKSKLIVPVDVHINRLCKILGLHNRSSVSLKTALEITRRFTEIEPADPVKYDFALSRIGILEDCTGRCRAQCQACELLSWCRGRRDWSI
ncbi:MAG: TIGR02757 family protein [Sedimentisphaerales bacterium]|nr:TIGR02757 family protein [Sedimentisphaerales bacterium]